MATSKKRAVSPAPSCPAKKPRPRARPSAPPRPPATTITKRPSSDPSSSKRPGPAASTEKQTHAQAVQEPSIREQEEEEASFTLEEQLQLVQDCGVSTVNAQPEGFQGDPTTDDPTFLSLAEVEHALLRAAKAHRRRDDAGHALYSLMSRGPPGKEFQHPLHDKQPAWETNINSLRQSLGLSPLESPQFARFFADYGLGGSGFMNWKTDREPSGEFFHPENLSYTVELARRLGLDDPALGVQDIMPWTYDVKETGQNPFRKEPAQVQAFVILAFQHELRVLMREGYKSILLFGNDVRSMQQEEVELDLQNELEPFLSSVYGSDYLALREAPPCDSLTILLPLTVKGLPNSTAVTITLYRWHSSDWYSACSMIECQSLAYTINGGLETALDVGGSILVHHVLTRNLRSSPAPCIDFLLQNNSLKSVQKFIQKVSSWGGKKAQKQPEEHYQRSHPGAYIFMQTALLCSKTQCHLPTILPSLGASSALLEIEGAARAKGLTLANVMHRAWRLQAVSTSVGRRDGDLSKAQLAKLDTQAQRKQKWRDELMERVDQEEGDAVAHYEALLADGRDRAADWYSEQGAQKAKDLGEAHKNYKPVTQPKKHFNDPRFWLARIAARKKLQKMALGKRKKKLASLTKDLDLLNDAAGEGEEAEKKKAQSEKDALAESIGLCELAVSNTHAKWENFKIQWTEMSRDEESDSDATEYDADAVEESACAAPAPLKVADGVQRVLRQGVPVEGYFNGPDEPGRAITMFLEKHDELPLPSCVWEVSLL